MQPVPGSHLFLTFLEPWAMAYLLCLPHPSTPSFFLSTGIFQLIVKYIKASSMLSSSLHSKPSSGSHLHFTLFSLLLLLAFHFLQLGLCPTIPWKCSYQSIHSLSQILWILFSSSYFFLSLLCSFLLFHLKEFLKVGSESLLVSTSSQNVSSRSAAQPLPENRSAIQTLGLHHHTY